MTLPAAFGPAYVGETFSCTLCANNEVHGRDGISVSDVEITAELQTPGAAHTKQAIPLNVRIPGRAAQNNETLASSQADTSASSVTEMLQGIIMQDLTEEGLHVLAVTVTYKESLPALDSDSAPTSPSSPNAPKGQARSFRKLYQFTAQQALGIRTKITEISAAAARDAITDSSNDDDNTGGEAQKQRSPRRRFTVEAQIENQTDQPLILEAVRLSTKPGLACASLNGYPDESITAGADSGETREQGASSSTIALAPGDVEQVAFVLGQRVAADAEGEGARLEVQNGRYVLAQMRVDWRVGLDQTGTLRTGWLGSLVK